MNKPAFNRYSRKRLKVDASIFRLGAESYSSLERVEKKKKIACPLLDVFACGQVSSPRLYRLRVYLTIIFPPYSIKLMYYTKNPPIPIYISYIYLYILYRYYLNEIPHRLMSIIIPIFFLFQKYLHR